MIRCNLATMILMDYWQFGKKYVEYHRNSSLLHEQGNNLSKIDCQYGSDLFEDITLNLTFAK
jgi:hypothetical protein